MAYSLHYSELTDGCLAVCTAASACSATVKLAKAADDLALPVNVALPLPSAGLPAIVTPKQNVFQDISAAVKAIGAPGAALYHRALCGPTPCKC